MALKDGVAKARPALLEPIMKLEVISPGQFLGDITGNITARRGHIETIETQYVEMCTIRCLIPLAETFGYATSLRSLTQGRANYSMEFHCYQELPAELTAQVTGKKPGQHNLATS